MDALQVLSTWLHTAAFVIAWGYYGVLGRMIIPGLERSLEPGARLTALLAIERRAVPIVLLSIVLFTITGSYMLVVDPEYAGFGSVLANTWTTLMLFKHVLVIILVALGVAVDLLIRRAAADGDDQARGTNLRWLRLSVEGATGVGALIALLTVAAQAAL